MVIHTVTNYRLINLFKNTLALLLYFEGKLTETYKG